MLPLGTAAQPVAGELPQTSLSRRARGGRLASCWDPEAPPCPSGGAAGDLRGAGLAPGSREWGTHRSRVRMSSSCSPGEGQGPVSLAGHSSQPPDPRVTCGFCLPCPHSHHPEHSARGAGGSRHAHQGHEAVRQTCCWTHRAVCGVVTAMPGRAGTGVGHPSSPREPSRPPKAPGHQREQVGAGGVLGPDRAFL